MPGFLTHYIGGQSVLETAGSNISGYIKPAARLYNLGTQGPDIFFYYVPGFITARIRGVGTQMHESDLGQYFMCMADFIKDSKSPAQRQILFAYTAGFLVHYAVDVHTHGYVYGRTHNPPTPKIEESTRHRHFETSVDVLMLARMYGRMPGDCNQRQLISPEKIHLRVAASAMSDAIRKVYNRNIGPIDVYRAMGQMATFTGCLQSANGRRKRLLGLAEDMTVRSRNISALIHMQEVTDGCDYLNLQKLPWSAPWAPENTRSESFVELFESAVADAANMVQALYRYVNSSLPGQELASIILNRSLKTGQHSQISDAGPVSGQNS